MSKVVDRFMRYISVDTRSNENNMTTPSTPNQKILAKMLADELKELGASNVRIDEEHTYVYAEIPANTETEHSIGFISHMDTAQELPGGATNARIVKDYDGGKVALSDTECLDPADFPFLANYKGQDLIVTDGTTLLGADDKGGVAEIMTMAENLLSDPSIKHGKIGIAFTPDEEIGRGADHFDIKGFGVDFAYTVDGDAVGEIQYENFNAATAVVSIEGKDIHPGSAKDQMINAARIAGEFDRLLPEDQRPEHTEGYEGFFHLTKINGSTGHTDMQYIIRDHDAEKFAARKQMMQAAAEFINRKYGNVLTLTITDAYKNMKEHVEPHMFLIEDAEKAFRACGVEPSVVPIRGGTDGAALSYKGLPCPNLSIGGHNYHSNTEFITVQALEKMAEVLTELATCK